MAKNSHLRIFIVDDDIFCLNLYQQFFIKLGYPNVSCFSGGRQCLEKLSHKPDLVLLDYYMDDLNGIDVLKEIKQHNPEIIVILVSGIENAEIGNEGKKYGAYDYIIKSTISIDVLKSMMERIESITSTQKSHSRSLLQRMKSGLGI